VPPDSTCPTFTPELQCLKDGDGLDRVRLGDFAPRYLRTRYLADQGETARALWWASQPRPGRTPWGLVRQAALARDLWA
jgi:hypothetical protein